MNATITERLISRVEIWEEKSGNDSHIFDQMVEVDSANDSKAFIIIDSLLILTVYLTPVAVFGYLVAPVVARLLSMPVSY